MARKLVCAAVALVLFALASPGVASVEGSWDVEGNLKIRVKIQGFPAQVQRGPAGDVLTFHPDGSFEMIDATGSWVQEGARFTVTLDPAEITTLFEQMFADAGMTVDVDIKKLRLKGKERSDSIRGKLKVKLGLFVHDVGAPGKVKTRYRFTGSPLVVVAGGPGGAGPDVKLMRGVIEELVREVAARIASP
jgi:hypothetical protein